MDHKDPSRWTAIILVLLGASSYGLLSPFIKLAFQAGFNDLQVSVSQITMGTLVLWLILLMRPKWYMNPFGEQWLPLVLIGIFGLALTTFFYNRSLQSLNAALSIILLFQFTWMTILLELIFLRRRPNMFQLIAVVMTMSGTLLTVGISAETFRVLHINGVVFGLLSGLTYSLFLFFAGRVKSRLHPVMKSAVMMTGALPIIYLVNPPHLIFQSGSGSLLGWGLLLGLMGQVFPTIFFNYGIPRIGSSLAAVLGAMELPVAVVGALLILGESVNGLQWAGIALILAGIYIAEKKSVH